MKTDANKPAPRGSASDNGAPPGGESLLRETVGAWDRFWFSPMDPTSLGLMRLFCGVMAFYVTLTYSWGLLGYVGPEGWLEDKVASYLRHKVPIYAPSVGWEGRGDEIDRGNYYWSIFYHVQDPRWIVRVHVGILVVMALFAAGLWTRYTSVLAWVGAMSYIQRSSLTVFGMDAMMMILLFYLMVGPSGSALSLDRLIERWRARRRGLPAAGPQPSVAANFAIRLFQVHFCIIYLAGGTSKLLGNSWWNATALNLVLLNYSFAPFYFPLYGKAITWLAQHRWMWELFVTGGVVFTLVVEIGFPFLVWRRRWRPVMICGSVLLHAGIGLLMGLVSFSLMMMIMVLSFVPPEVVRQGIERLRQRACLLLRPRPHPGLPPPRQEPLVLTR